MGISAGAYIGVNIVTQLITLVTGRSIDIEIGRYRGLFVFIGLYTIAFSGVMALTNLFTAYIGWAIPPLAGTAGAITIIAQTLASITLAYYVAVKVFGIPSF